MKLKKNNILKKIKLNSLIFFALYFLLILIPIVLAIAGPAFNVGNRTTDEDTPFTLNLSLNTSDINTTVPSDVIWYIMGYSGVTASFSNYSWRANTSSQTYLCVGDGCGAGLPELCDGCDGGGVPNINVYQNYSYYAYGNGTNFKWQKTYTLTQGSGGAGQIIFSCLDYSASWTTVFSSTTTTGATSINHTIPSDCLSLGRPIQLKTYMTGLSGSPNDQVIYSGSKIWANVSDVLQIIPDANWTGYANVTLNVSDNSTMNSSFFGVLVNGVNDAPSYNTSQVAITDINFSEDGTNNTVDLTPGEGNVFYDVDSSLTAFNYAINTTNIRVSINNATGIATFTATANWSGDAKINFSAYDGTAWTNANSSQFDVGVGAVNDAPDINRTNATQIDNLSLWWNVTLWANATDLEGDAISYVNFTLFSPNGSKEVDNVMGTQSGVLWNLTPFNLSAGGRWSVYVNASDSLGGQTGVAWNFTLNIINFTIRDMFVTDLGLGKIINITANVTVDSPVKECNWSFNYPNGSRLMENSTGNASVKSYNYEEWVHSVELQKNGTYLGNITCLTDNGYSSYYGYQFIVKDEWLLSPMTYLEALQSAGDSILFNVSFRPSADRNFSYDFNISTYPFNDTAYNVSINHSFNSTQYALSNHSIWGIPVNITTTAGLANGSYKVNLTVFRTNVGYHRNETLEFFISAYPPSGNIVIANDSEGHQCAGSFCDKVAVMTRGLAYTSTWYLNNTGGFNLSECYASVDNSLSALTYGFSINNFSVSNESTSLTEFSFGISNAPEGLYQGYLNLTCKANNFGERDSLVPDQRPYLIVYVPPAGALGGGGAGGGGAVEKVEFVLPTNVTMMGILEFITGDGLCEFEKGEDFGNSKADCKLKLEHILQSLKQAWFLRILFFLGITSGLIIFTGGNPALTKKFKKLFKKKKDETY